MSGAAVMGIGWFTSRGPGRGGAAGEFVLDKGPLPPVHRKDVFPEPNPRFGRLPQYSRVGLAAAALALRDAGAEQWEEKRPVGVVASSCAGCLRVDLEYYDTVLPEGGGLPSPNLFSSTLPTCFLGEAAIQFGLTGATLIVDDDGCDGLNGIRTALDLLSCGECETMLAGHIDLPGPLEFPAIQPPRAGGLFLVLDRPRKGCAPRYGTLDLSDGLVRHNGTGSATVEDLVRACIRSDPGRGTPHHPAPPGSMP